MTHEKIKNEIARLIQVERQNLSQFLTLLKKAEDERSYIAFDFTSLFDWLVRYFKYPSGCAQRRLEAVRLMRVIPEVKDKLEQGSLSLSSLNTAQAIIKAQEKATNTRLTTEAKAEALKQIENQSAKKATETLLQRFPEAAPDVEKPQTRLLKNNITQFSMNFSTEDMEELQRAKELLSHTLPTADQGDIFKYLLREYNKRKDPLRKSISAAEMNRKENGQPSQAQTRREVFQSNDGKCCYVHANGRICGEKISA